ncbi:hypothetical protein AMJ83_06705 [candidate division WOR_3 bacterium SM23_42]|uniref:Fibronectin type-III domain-containing protein n=1 Tax=candidate division WOR_3 bacterium SM23_42 TaxID=1703779 RepID=A0A0S8FRU9_UNCW3|nr:MAG: hypothetical protein AMJ83_06705 [candidate division WOR_3 bacterium SM23_42]
MKVCLAMLKFMAVFIIVILANFNPGCKDPHEYQPLFDSLYPPPAAPNPISPENDTVIWYGQWDPYPNNLDLVWSSVDGTEYYELQVSTSTDFTGVTSENVYDTVYTYQIETGGHRYWRLRAYAREWEWYTDWTETWHFTTWYSP